MGLAVHHPFVVGHYRFGQHILGLVVLAVLTAVHHHEPVVRQLRADGFLQVVGLRHHVCLLVGAKAEAAVGAGGHGSGVVFSVQAFPLCFLRECLLLKAGGAVVEDVHVPVVGVVGDGVVGVDPSAPQTHRLGPVVPGVDAAVVGRLIVHVGGLPGGGVTVGIADVPHGVRHAGRGVLRHPVGDAGGVNIGLVYIAVLLDGTIPALHGAVGAGGVLGEGVGPIAPLQPVFRRVVVDVFLAGGAGGQGNHPQHKGKRQEQCKEPFVV